MAKNEALAWDKSSVKIEYSGKTYEAPVETNLLMRTMSSVEIKTFLNEVPGKAVYWANFKVDLELAYDELSDEYDEWYQGLYAVVDEEFPKKTEAWKKSKITMENTAEYRDWKERLREVQTAIKRVGVLLSGFNNTVWTVREIARITTAEIGSMSSEGGR